MHRCSYQSTHAAMDRVATLPDSTFRRAVSSDPSHFRDVADGEMVSHGTQSTAGGSRVVTTRVHVAPPSL